MLSKIKFIFVFLTLLIINCTVIFELIGTQRQPISRSEVSKYDEIPVGADKIGNVTVSLGSSFGGAEAYSQIKKKAAKVGANGYTIISKKKTTGFTNGFGQPSGGMYHVTAVVFYVKLK